METAQEDYNDFRVISNQLPEGFKTKMLYYAAQEKACTYLTNNNIEYPYGPFEELLAIGIKEEVKIGTDTFQSIQDFHDTHRQWMFGFLTYDLKNELENLESNNDSSLSFPKAGFYVPKHIIRFFDGKVSIQSDKSPEELISEIEGTVIPVNKTKTTCKEIQRKVDKTTYLQKIEEIKQHIIEGNVYELNYCIENIGYECQMDTVDVFLKLNERSPMPFAAFQKYGNHFAMCASPERFIKKIGNKLISQPIKGTIKRGNNTEHDEALKDELLNSEKERAENMMIVDLVRNDLAKSANIGSVQVEEIFGIYTFQSLHQMISTVRAELKESVPFTTAIKNAFPMGSMTGAPKIKAMELIDELESFKREMFSGSIGYISPSANFDFNVVIRTILYNSAHQVLATMIGSAITIDSEGEYEWSECSLKSSSMDYVLGF